MLPKPAQPRLSHAAISALSALFLTFIAVGCIASAPAESDKPRDPFSNPKFLTPVAEAEDADVELYWLGEQFQAGSFSFGVGGANEFIDRPEGPGLKFSYSADIGRGFVSFDVEAFSAQPGGAGLGGAAVTRERALAVPGTTSRDVRVGSWNGELFSVPSATRPVNHLWLFVDLGDTIVVGKAASGGPGIPGEDANPLIQADLLIEVMEQLRPYPE